MRSSTAFFVFLGGCVALFALSLVDSNRRSRGAEAAIRGRTALVAELELTDLALFTEARYTRHLSQADLHSAFQDHPLGLEHFPSGSLVPPPAILSEPDERRP